MGKLGEALKSSAVNSANLITLNDKDLKRMQEAFWGLFDTMILYRGTMI